MRILAIETSCDETGLAVVEGTGTLAAPQIKIRKEVLTSQIAVHAPWGGVVPNLAKREHIKNLPILLRRIEYRVARIEKTVDLVAVTVGPGLEPALWAGIEFAKQLAKKWSKPLVGVNHMEGHLYSPLLNSHCSLLATRKFPAIALVVSGGHTMLLKMEGFGKRKKLGETRDDAAGEAFDKVARLLDLPYPGGPEISKLALRGDPLAIPFPQPMLHSKDFDFSFSGLKTAVLYYLRDNYPSYVIPGPFSHSERSEESSLARRDGARARRGPSGLPRDDKWEYDIAASFEFAAVNVLAEKTFRAVMESGAKSVWLAGGVAANPHLRKTFESRAKQLKIPVIMPDMAHNTDNAAMIGAAAYMNKLRGKKYALRARGDLNI